MELVAKQIPDRPVVFVAGNHEFYGRELEITQQQIRAALRGTSVHPHEVAHGFRDGMVVEV